MEKRVYTALCFVQGGYTVLTALWALIDIKSFMAVTGPKTDIWLVKTVATLLVPIGTVLLLGPLLKKDFWIVLLLGTSTSAGLAIIDFYYTANGTIRWIYQLDGFIELAFLLTWLFLLSRLNKI